MHRQQVKPFRPGGIWCADGAEGRAGQGLQNHAWVQGQSGSACQQHRCTQPTGLLQPSSGGEAGQLCAQPGGQYAGVQQLQPVGRALVGLQKSCCCLNKRL